MNPKLKVLIKETAAKCQKANADCFFESSALKRIEAALTELAKTIAAEIENPTPPAPPAPPAPPTPKE